MLIRAELSNIPIAWRISGGFALLLTLLGTMSFSADRNAMKTIANIGRSRRLPEVPRWCGAGDRPLRGGKRRADTGRRNPGLGTQQVSQNIAGVSLASNETETAAEQVLSAAGSLAQEAERLRGEMAHFLANVRSA